MKKIILALTLLVGLNSSIAQTNVKIGHVDYQSVIDSIPSKLNADKEMKDFIDDGQKTIEELQTLFQRDYEVYMGTRDSLSQMIREIKEKNLSEQQQIITMKQESLQNDLQIINERLYTPIEKSFKAAVKTVSEKYKLNYVLEISSLMYQNGGLDITKEVKTELIKLETTRAAN